MSENSNPYIVYHQKVELPLYRIPYHVIIGEDSLSACLTHAEKVFPGTSFKNLPTGHQGHTLVLSHPVEGKSFVVCLNLQPEETFVEEIVHLATHLSWEIMSKVGISPTHENNESQAFICSAIFKQITQVVANFHKSDNSENKDIDDL